MKYALRTILILSIVLSCGWTYKLYYYDFTRHSPVSFERDRMRNSQEVYQYIQEHYQPSDTLLILGDGINVSPWAEMFHNFDKPFAYLVWTNYLDSKSKAQEFLDLENREFNLGFKHIVYIFAYTLIQYPDNDWRAFLQAHPNIQRKNVVEYCYDGRALLVMIGVDK